MRPPDAPGAPEGSPWGDKALPFVAVGRVKDGVTLAFYFSTEHNEQLQEQSKDVFRKLLLAAKSKLQANQKTRLQWNEGSVCCLMDQQATLLYCVVTSLVTYPERLAYQLLYDLVVTVNTLNQEEVLECQEHEMNAKLKDKMKELVHQYEDPANFPMIQRAMDPLQVTSGSSSRDLTRPSADPQQRNRVMLATIVVLVLLVIVLAVVKLK